MRQQVRRGMIIFHQAPSEYNIYKNPLDTHTRPINLYMVSAIPPASLMKASLIRWHVLLSQRLGGGAEGDARSASSDLVRNRMLVA